MRLRELVFELVKKIKQGTTIDTRRIQSAIRAQFPDQCDRLGFTATKPIEEKWKKDIRFALRDEQDKGLIKHIGSPKSCLWRRL